MAIYVEGALDIVLPDSVLEANTLESPETAVATVTALLGDH